MPTTVIFAESEIAAHRIAGYLPPSDRRSVIASTTDVASIAPLVSHHRPDLLLVELGEKAEATLDAIDTLPETRPLLLVMGPEHDSRLILRAMRMGAREYLPLSGSPGLLRDCLASLATRHAWPEEEAAAIGVMGTKGGVGATLVCCQLAMALRRLGSSVTLVDLELSQGDIDLYLDLEPSYTWADIARREGAIDAAYLRTILQEHPSGIRVLAAPDRLEAARLVRGQHVEDVASVLRESAQWLIFDLPRDFDELTLRGLDQIDLLLLVTTVDIPSLHHARRILGLLERRGFDGQRVRLVANRDARVNAVSDRDLADFVGRPVDERLPNDFEAAQECVSFGKGLLEAAPRSVLRTSFDELALRLHDHTGRPRPILDEPSNGLRGYLRKALHGPA